VNRRSILASNAPPATILIRLVVGGVFLLEGILKFLYPDQLGAGRFQRIGIPAPEMMGPFVSAVEVICGALLLLGLLTRIATFPLLIDITVAIISTKAPILLGHGFGRFTLPKADHYGFLGMLHESRTDYSMLLGLLFLLIVGAGRLSLDARMRRGFRLPDA
jgi:putative oxidoreductase